MRLSVSLALITLWAAQSVAKTCKLRPLGRGKSDVSQIEAAIAVCGHGGTTVLEAGEYNITRKMRWNLVNSRVDLHGVLNFVFDLPYWMNPSSTDRVIFIQSQASWFTLTGHDFTLDGHQTGGIVGNGQRWWSWYGNATRLDGDGRPVSLTLSHVQRAVVRDFTVHAPPFWCNAVADSRDVVYDGMRCVAENADERWFGQNVVWNTDGIDTFRSDNITMINWDITSGDDCLAIKGNSTNIFARNITCRGGTGIAFGSLGQYEDLPDYVENVVLDDITFIRPDNAQVQPLMEHGVYFKSWTGTRIGFPPTGGGAGLGRVSGVVARNIKVDEVTTPIQLYQTNLGHPGDAPSQLHFANLTFVNWTGTAQTSTIVDLECSYAAPCADITFDKISIEAGSDAGEGPAYRCVNVASATGVPTGEGCVSASAAVKETVLCRLTTDGASTLVDCSTVDKVDSRPGEEADCPTLGLLSQALRHGFRLARDASRAHYRHVQSYRLVLVSTSSLQVAFDQALTAMGIDLLVFPAVDISFYSECMQLSILILPTMAAYTESKQLKVTKERLWYRAHFYDHPGYGETPRDPQSKDAADKTKIWCKLCFQQRVSLEMQLDEQNGRTREGHEIELYLWSLPAGRDELGPRWIPATTERGFAHLRDCELTHPDIRTKAAQDYDIYVRSPRSARRAAQRAARERHAQEAQRSTVPPVAYYPAPAVQVPRIPFNVNASPSAGANSTLGESPTTLSPLFIPGTAGPSGSPGQVSTDSPYPLQFASSPSPYPFTSYSPHPHPAPSPSPSVSSTGSRASGYRRSYDAAGLGLHVGSPTPLAKRPARASGTQSLSRQASSSGIVTELLVPEFSPDRRQLFESFLARLTAALGLPLSWVENPIWIEFVEEFISGCSAPNPTPSRKVLTTRIIPATVKHYRTIAQLQCRGKLVTIQCDGFTAANRHHLVSFMITVERKVYTVRTYDTSTEPKTAENLVRMIYEVMHILETEWEVIPVAVTTDCSGESRAARARILAERPSLVTPDCYAHQVERVVIDYFAVKTDIFFWTKQADEIIAWLRSRTYLLGLLNKVQLQLPGAASRGPPKTVIKGAPTRWTTMYLSYKRLLELKLALEHLALHPELNASGNRDSRQKTEDMLNRLKSSLFWHNLARVKLHLEPLAVAANITQSDDCRLDDVLLTFGYLYQSFNALVEPQDDAVRTAVLESLEKRWAKADQDVFIAAVLLNPYLRLSPFRASLTQYFVPAAMIGLIHRLWDRFYPGVLPKPTLSDLKDYLNFSGATYMSMPIVLRSESEEARRKGISPDPVEIWNNFIPKADPTSHTRIPPPPLPTLAIRVLSICPSAGNCERLFSILGIIMSDRRTRLSTTNLLNIAELRLHLRDEQVRKDAKKRLKRHFGERIMQATESRAADSQLPAETNQSVSSAPGNEQSLPSDRSSRIRQAIADGQRGLQELIEYMEERDTEDSILTSDSFTSMIREPLHNLLDFSNEYWQARANSSPSNTLEEELAIWDLLDMDADGDDDSLAGQGSDDMTNDILLVS